MDKTSVIFNNKMSKHVIKKANRSKQKFAKKFPDNKKVYHLGVDANIKLGGISIANLAESNNPLQLGEKPVIIGTIRMGFGHYRISIAMASCAKALGYNPYWLNLNDFDTTGGKMIRYQNDRYSMGSRLSQKSKLFNKLFWDPLNKEGFKKISYNAVDQKNSELLAPIYNDFPKDVPFIATHVWPSQGAIHAGLTHVVNAIPDNWPMALHLSEGAIHTVQTPFAYLGYKTLNKMDKKPLNHMPENSLFQTGHYIDHEMLINLEKDVEERISRLNQSKPLRFLLTIGGAGAQSQLFKDIIVFCKQFIEKKQMLLFVNFGDHYNNLNLFQKEGLLDNAKIFANEYNQFIEYTNKMTNDESGLIALYNKDIFEAVYSTNVLIPKCDVLLTKPSELAFYPIPKLMIQHVGGHEAYGAIHASEIGDGTFECDNIEDIKEMINSLFNSKEILINMNNNIINLKEQGMYNGAYEVVKLAVKGIEGLKSNEKQR